MTELQSLLAAVGIQLLTALTVVRIALRSDPDAVRRPRGAHRPPATLPADDEATPGGATAIAAPSPPALARVNEPQPSVDPDRLIQTEVLLPDGPAVRARSVGRLVAGLVAFGVTLAAAVIGTVRGVAWFVRRLSGS